MSLVTHNVTLFQQQIENALARQALEVCLDIEGDAMSTKRSPKSAATAANKDSKLTPTPAPQSATTKTDPIPPVTELSRTHELIVDAVTSMLTTGGHRDDVDSLIYAAMGHTRRRTYGVSADDWNEHSDKITEYVHDEHLSWRTDLAIGWRKNERAEPSAFEPETIKDRIRATVRERVRRGFENFMSTAAPEEQRLLQSIFEVWESSSLPAEYGSDEMVLGDAFEFALGRNATFVKIPRRMLDKVQQYIDALRAIEDK